MTMRRSGEIRQKLKQAQYRHLKRKLLLELPAEEDWPQEDVDKIKGGFREFLSTAPLHEIARLYPDIAALLWVLEEMPDEPLAVNGTLVGRIGGVDLWADTEDDASYARSVIDQLVEIAQKNSLPKEEVPHKENHPKDAPPEHPIVPSDALVPLNMQKPGFFKGFWQRLFG